MSGSIEQAAMDTADAERVADMFCSEPTYRTCAWRLGRLCEKVNVQQEGLLDAHRIGEVDRFRVLIVVVDGWLRYWSAHPHSITHEIHALLFKLNWGGGQFSGAL